jgi:hypothetical protein
MMQYIKQQENKEFIFLTLTTPNVNSDELENEIKGYNNSFRKLIKKKVDSVIKGSVVKLNL